MKATEKLKRIVEIFRNELAVPQTELNFRNPYELIVAVILSAQCTDVRVNKICPALFEKFPDAVRMASATEEEIFEIIRSCSYPNNKAKHLLGMARMLVNDFKGVVPDDIDLLQKLPGVGRKTANVIASVAFNQEALAVDTHVFRVSARLGFSTKAKTPIQTEQILVQIAEKGILHDLHHWLILHGRYVCKARKPLCESCKIKDYCAYFKSLQAKKKSLKTTT